MKTFNKIVSEHFTLAENEVTDALTMHDIPGWDSMNFLLLIADIEKEFGMTFTMDEVLSFNSLGDIRKVLEAKGK
jgi:acyl carrier protein